MIQETLERIRACEEAIAWAEKKPNWSAVIRDCKRIDWLLWLDRKLNILTDSERMLLVCWFVRNTPLVDRRKAWDLLTDKRSRNAVKVAERHARGEATDEELTAARKAAWAEVGVARDVVWRVAWAAGAAAREAHAQHIIDRYADRFIAAITNVKP